MKHGKIAVEGDLAKFSMGNCMWVPIDRPIYHNCTQLIISHNKWHIDYTDCTILDEELHVPLQD